MNHRTTFLGAALLLAAHAAGAQAIYRCGSSYSAQPCAGATLVEPQANASAQDAAQARRGAQADAKLAGELEKARLAREKAAPKALVIGPVEKEKENAAAAKPAKKDGKDAKAGKSPGEFTAMGPRPAKPAK